MLLHSYHFSKQINFLPEMTRESFMIMLTILFAFNLSIVKSISYVQLFGLESTMEDLVKAQPVVHYTGEQSVSYAVDNKLMNFLKNFQSRTQFCDHKCPKFYQVTCFILFQCNIQLRNILLIIISPLFTIAMIGLCCGKGIWTFSCWTKYIGLFTGLFLVVWFIKKFTKGYETIQRRKREKEYIKDQREKQDMEIEPVFTQKRLYEAN